MAVRFRLLPAVVLALGALFIARTGEAHFQFLLPSTDTVSADGSRTVDLDLVFSHPMARGPAMEMEKPVRFAVKNGDDIADLTGGLERRTVDGKTAWAAAYRVARPGNYTFFVEPRPYWEPAEGKMIVHYTKVTVDAFDWGEGWDEPVGLPVEIMPLIRPYGIWTGNVFRGVVLKDGEPLPHAEIEVEWRNDGSVAIPAAAYETQVIKADERGIFAYGIPRAGWWAFAALTEAEKTMRSPDGTDVPVELGGVIWVRARDMR